MTRWLIAVLGAALLLACPPADRGDPLRTLPDAAYPGELRAPDSWGPDVMVRQRVTAHWGDGASRGFDAVLQKQGGVLKLVGLTPMSTVAFVVTQDGDAVTMENKTDQVLPFPPRFILLDVQRVLFPWLSASHTSDGQRAGNVGEELVVERFVGDALVERTFERRDGVPPGVIRVTYQGWDAGPHAPRRAQLDNGWFGYRLVIETTQQQQL